MPITIKHSPSAIQHIVEKTVTLNVGQSRSFSFVDNYGDKVMCYIGVEYECSKDISLQFYSKEFLKSFPETHGASSYFLLMRLKSDKKTGSHGLSLKGCAIQTAVSPDTTKILAEMFLYMEKVDAWEEIV